MFIQSNRLEAMSRTDIIKNFYIKINFFYY